MGIDRLAMLKYGINDLRALKQFGFDPLDNTNIEPK